MEYFLSFLLLGLNLLDYEHNINKFVFLAVGTVIFVALFNIVRKKTQNFLCTCLIMFCHTWQISWINIFGEPTSSLQLPWFYLVGVLIILYAFVHIRELFRKERNAIILLCFALFFVVSVFPIYISPSKSEAMKEFVMILFFAAILFVAFLYSDSIPREKKELISRAFIWAAFLSSVFIIVQTVSYHVFDTVLFKYEISNYMGATQTGAMLLMEDTSCATIMIGASVFYMVEGINAKSRKYLIPMILITVASLAMTTRRTSVITLIIIFGIYCFIRYKGVAKKTAMAAVFICLTGIMVFYLMMVRPVDNISMYLYENGRIENYIRCIKLAFTSPFGVGYDNKNLTLLMDNHIIPHNTLLRWLAMGGWWFILPLVIVIGYTVKASYKKKFTEEFWILIYAIAASNFIPDVLNGRFFIIPCATALLLAGKKKAGGQIPQPGGEAPRPDTDAGSARGQIRI